MQALAMMPRRCLRRPWFRSPVRDAAAALLTAWDASRCEDATNNPNSRAVEQLRAALASKMVRTPREPGAPRKPREGTKQELVLAMLRRPEGATVAQIADTTGWAQHTVRGFFAGLKKKGHAVEVMRCGMNGLALQLQQALGRDPHAGDLYVFRGKRSSLIKIAWHDRQGM
jgi:hypothetical protein